MEWLFHFACIYLEGETENAVASKMQGWKLREWVNRHQGWKVESAIEASMDIGQPTVLLTRPTFKVNNINFKNIWSFTV